MGEEKPLTVKTLDEAVKEVFTFLENTSVVKLNLLHIGKRNNVTEKEILDEIKGRLFDAN